MDLPGLFLSLAEKGGPSVEDYGPINRCLVATQQAVAEGKLTLEAVRKSLSLLGDDYMNQTLQGHCMLKPYGYAGDFSLIDKLYKSWVTQDGRFSAWDAFTQSQPGILALKNRLKYFGDVLETIERNNPRERVSVLNVGSGPGRDMFDYLVRARDSKAVFLCVEQDVRAIEYARTLCADYLSRISFQQGNAFRFRASQSFDLVWSAGLFDYLNDRLFKRLLTRLLSFVAEDGEIIIANFSPTNPSRDYMEIVGGWQLIYRDGKELHELAVAAGVNAENIQVQADPTGIIHFLHVKPSGS